MIVDYYIPNSQKWNIPIKIAIFGDREYLKELKFIDMNISTPEINNNLPKWVQNLHSILDHYFLSGHIDNVTMINQFHLESQLKTPFIKKVLLNVSQIPIGQTLTYGDVGKHIFCQSARAIGMALRSNPFPILIPCHRVIGKTNLGGFMGVTDIDRIELKIKKSLLELEGWQSNHS